MFKDIENLKIEDIQKGVSYNQSHIKDRKSSSFVLRTKGVKKYDFAGQIIDVNEGEIILLPKGSSYTTYSLSDETTEFLSIRFNADLKDAKPCKFPLDNFSDLDELVNVLPDLWRFGGKSEHYRCYSVFYNLLSYLEFLENQSYMDKNKLSIIEPAVSYLKKHIYDSNLKTDGLCDMCSISGVYFRKIFSANFGMSPQKYILSKRLSHAKTIIDTGDYGSISEVASLVGYNDPLYFSRAFKKKYGLSPTEYAKT